MNDAELFAWLEGEFDAIAEMRNERLHQLMVIGRDLTDAEKVEFGDLLDDLRAHRVFRYSPQSKDTP